MQCPTCQVTLQMADRQGIEVDYCPKCRGIWLDRGELEKLIERSTEHEAHASGPPRQDPSYGNDPRYRGDYDRDRDRDRDRDYDRGYYKKRESWLCKLLDFD